MKTVAVVVLLVWVALCSTSSAVLFYVSIWQRDGMLLLLAAVAAVAAVASQFAVLMLAVRR